MSLKYAKRFVRETNVVTREDIDAAKERITSGQTSILSKNLTCGVAINVSISHTCKSDGISGEGASRLCAVACYAKAGNMGMRWAIMKSMAVYELIRDEPVEWVAARIHGDYVRYSRRLHGRLRWNASGDLFPQEVALINHMAENPELYPFIDRHYLYTKRPTLMNQLAHRPDKIAAFVSLDDSNQRISQLVRWPWAQAAWMVTDPSEEIPETVPARTPQGFIPVTVEFPDHELVGQLPTTARTCHKLRPEALGGIPMKDACAACTRCSDDPSKLLQITRRVA